MDGVRVAEEEREVLDEAAPQPSKNELFGMICNSISCFSTFLWQGDL